MTEEKVRKQWGWFSSEKADEYGYSIHEGVVGDQVKVTAVSTGESPVNPYGKGLKQKVNMVGEVVRFISGRHFYGVHSSSILSKDGNDFTFSGYNPKPISCPPVVSHRDSSPWLHCSDQYIGGNCNIIGGGGGGDGGM